MLLTITPLWVISQNTTQPPTRGDQLSVADPGFLKGGGGWPDRPPLNLPLTFLGQGGVPSTVIWYFGWGGGDRKRSKNYSFLYPLILLVLPPIFGGSYLFALFQLLNIVRWVSLSYFFRFPARSPSLFSPPVHSLSRGWGVGGGGNRTGGFRFPDSHIL